MKRREYCALSKSVSQYVLEQILSGEPTEVVVENIHEYLNTIGENVRSGKIKLEDFIVYKRLGKNPEDYPDAKSQPHVQVALRLKAKGGSARNGDVIPYVFCVAPGEETVKTAQADRAKHPDEIKKAAGELTVDYEHYLANQVLPPIERLCEPIEGTDRARLAECLGLDPGRYRISGSTPAGSALTTLDSLVSDAERFRDVAPFLVRCRGCAGQMAFPPVYDRDASILLSSGPTCPACSAPLGSASLQTQLEVQIRSFVARYYEGWIVCEDPACGYETRSMRMYGWRCGAPGGCKGRVRFKYGDTELYTQLRYFSTLFDIEKIIKAAQGNAKKEEIVAVATNNDPFLRAMSKTVDKYMEQCGRCWVNLGALFSSMNL
jgi:DNA polymerase alpha subunit A